MAEPMTDPGLDEGGQGHLWRRPIPTVGDATTASERASHPAGWAMAEEAQFAIDDVIRARRDVRRFRADPIPEELLSAVLSSGHAAPSVGHSQPWRFIVVQDPATRERAALFADRERLRQAALLEPDRRGHLLDLQLEGLREAPLGVVVACDRRSPATGVLGRATFPDADLWSCACAVQNMWLTSRAAGLGMGWVTLFQPEDLADLLGLPAGVQTVGWLCLGWPDERPPAPGLERVGWSRRASLESVVLRERWPDDGDAPAAPPSFLRAPEPRQVVAARDGGDRLLTPPGSLGVLDRAVDRVVALGRGAVDGGTLILVGSDHPVADMQVSAYPKDTTEEVIRAAAAGQSLGVVAARGAGLDTHVVAAGLERPCPGVQVMDVSGPRGDIAGQDALSAEAVDSLMLAGRVLGRALGAKGLVVLGEVAIGNTTLAAAMTCALLGLSPQDGVGRGAGADSEMLERKREVVTRALNRVRDVGPERAGEPLSADPVRIVGCLGGPEFAVLAGVCLGAAEVGAPIVLDGLVTGVAALVAVRLEPAVAAHLIAGHRSRERAHRFVLEELGVEPLLDLRIRAGEGAGACLAASMVLQGAAIRRHTGQVSH